MQKRKHYLRPDLIQVEERPDLRRSVRVVSGSISARLTATDPSLPNKQVQPKDCHCVDLSEHGIAVLCDSDRISSGDRVSLDLLQGGHRMDNLTGSVVRAEVSQQHTRLGIEFDHQHFTHPLFQAILGR